LKYSRLPWTRMKNNPAQGAQGKIAVQRHVQPTRPSSLRMIQMNSG
jgi:hypothetical protein